MGLQYVDGSGIERTLTVADMLTPDFQEAYSDLYKGLNGFRPRGHDAETMLRFFDSYEERMAEHVAEEAAELARLSNMDGIQYRSWSHYYDEQERRDYDAWERAQAERQEALDYRAAFNARFSSLPAIEAWEHGAI